MTSEKSRQLLLNVNLIQVLNSILHIPGRLIHVFAQKKNKSRQSAAHHFHLPAESDSAGSGGGLQNPALPGSRDAKFIVKSKYLYHKACPLVKCAIKRLFRLNTVESQQKQVAVHSWWGRAIKVHGKFAP